VTTPARPVSDPAWIEIVARVAPPDVDAVAEVLGEVAPDGISIEPAIRTLDHDNFQYELLDEPTVLRACVLAPFGESQRRALRRRIAALPLSARVPPLLYAPVRTTDWSEEWKRFFHVLRVGRLVVCPSWEEAEARPGDLVIDLDPGKAFGTGQHETTRLCLAALDAHLRPGMRVLDVGTGSGILAIAAVLLGATQVQGIDIDVEAVEVARANVERNGVSSQVSLAAGSLGDAWPWPESARADLVVANISSLAAVALLPACAVALPDGGLWVGSGFIESAAPTIEAAVRAAGLRPIATTAEADWRCIVAVKEGR
jgi:ribosomal protein L11 methyltransferase